MPKARPYNLAVLEHHFIWESPHSCRGEWKFNVTNDTTTTTQPWNGLHKYMLIKRLCNPLRGWAKERGAWATGMPPALPADNRMNPLSGIYGFLCLKSGHWMEVRPPHKIPKKELKCTPEIISNVKQMLKWGGHFLLLKCMYFCKKTSYLILKYTVNF